jgi:hypothetical protein
VRLYASVLQTAKSEFADCNGHTDLNIAKENNAAKECVFLSAKWNLEIMYILYSEFYIGTTTNLGWL